MYGQITPSVMLSSLNENQRFAKSSLNAPQTTVYQLIGKFFDKFECEDVLTGEIKYFSEYQLVFVL